MLKFEYDELKDILRKNVVFVNFVKKNGASRIMKCTLDPQYMPKPTESRRVTPRVVNEEVMSVWDMDNEGFRSFRMDSLRRISFLENVGENNRRMVFVEESGEY